MVISDPGVDRCGTNALVAEMVLDELEGNAGIEQVRRDRMAQAMAGVAAVEAGAIAVATEKGLDLALLEWSVSTDKQRAFRVGGGCQMFPEEFCRHGKERLLRPRPALETPDDDPASHEIDITPSH